MAQSAEFAGSTADTCSMQAGARARPVRGPQLDAMRRPAAAAAATAEAAAADTEPAAAALASPVYSSRSPHSLVGSSCSARPRLQAKRPLRPLGPAAAAMPAMARIATRATGRTRILRGHPAGRAASSTACGRAAGPRAGRACGSDRVCLVTSGRVERAIEPQNRRGVRDDSRYSRGRHCRRPVGCEVKELASAVLEQVGQRHKRAAGRQARRPSGATATWAAVPGT